MDLAADICEKSVFSYVFHTFPIEKSLKTRCLFTIFCATIEPEIFGGFTLGYKGELQTKN